jgi:hypothetical protein
MAGRFGTLAEPSSEEHMHTRMSWVFGLAGMAAGGLLSMVIQESLDLRSGSGARADELQPRSAASGPAVPEYVTKAEVARVCRDIGLRDWTQLTQTKVTVEEARKILAVVKPADLNVDLEYFQSGLEVELEHGLKFPEANVTNNHPILTGRIVVAHLLEVSDYYQRLKVVELEADLLKTLHAANSEQTRAVYRQLVAARIAVNRGEAVQLRSK